MVKLELYRVFREVAEAGNISLAAENLYLSQSAVSQSVKQLEQQLGTRLFLRSPRGVTLTEDGRLLFEYVRSAMAQCIPVTNQMMHIIAPRIVAAQRF